MERSGSQKFLKFVSVIAVIFGSIGIFFGLMFLLGGGLIGTSAQAAVEGMTNQEASIASMTVGLIALIPSICELISGILGIRAANDARKIMPVWFFSLIGFLLPLIGLGAKIATGSMTGDAVASLIVPLIGSGIMFWIASNIKAQANWMAYR